MKKSYFLNTILKTKDNSGCKKVKVVSNRDVKLKGSKAGKSSVMKFMKVSVVKCNPTRSKGIQRKKLYYAVALTNSSKYGRRDGSSIKFDKTYCCLVSKDIEPFASRIQSPIKNELKYCGNARFRLISIGSC